MRHQAENAARFVANARDVANGAVRVVPRRVTERETPLRFERVENRRVASHKLPFGVRDREIHLVDAAEENALVALDFEMRPTVDVNAAVVPSEGRRGADFVVRDEDSALDQNLEAVANPQDEFVGVFEAADRVEKTQTNLRRENSARRDVVAVAEAAREAHNLEAVDDRRVFQEAVDVNPLGRRARQFKRVGGFVIAVRSGRS